MAKVQSLQKLVEAGVPDELAAAQVNAAFTDDFVHSLNVMSNDEAAEALTAQMRFVSAGAVRQPPKQPTKLDLHQPGAVPIEMNKPADPAVSVEKASSSGDPQTIRIEDPTPFETALRIIRAEINDGCRDRVVMGGLAAYLPHLRRQVAETTTDPELHTLTLDLETHLSKYRELDANTRLQLATDTEKLIAEALANRYIELP